MIRKFERAIFILKKRWAEIEAALIIAEGGMRKEDIRKLKKEQAELIEAMKLLGLKE